MKVTFSTATSTVVDLPGRLASLRSTFFSKFESQPTFLISAPGRSELIGNHTDHNLGMVIATAVDLDALAVVAPRNDTHVRFHSAGWDRLFTADLSARSVDKKKNEHDSERLLRGVAAALAEWGVGITGFDACVESRVLPGSGLSSSAAMEALFAEILLRLDPVNTELSTVEIALAGKYAENTYLGKPSGLMDQMACIHGGVIHIDFESSPPEITPLPSPFEDAGMKLVVLDSGGDHVDLTPAYAAVPEEMKSVAHALGVPVLRQASRSEFFRRIPELRTLTGGDRAVLRALHYFRENDRVARVREAFTKGDVDTILGTMNESGASSRNLLQNVDTGYDPTVQPLLLSLAMADDFIRREGIPGAVRPHGGGFAGTILVVLPETSLSLFLEEMEDIFGRGSVIPLSSRHRGVISASLT